MLTTVRSLNAIFPIIGAAASTGGVSTLGAQIEHMVLAEVFAVDDGESILIATMLSTIIMRRPASQGDSETVEP